MIFKRINGKIWERTADNKDTYMEFNIKTNASPYDFLHIAEEFRLAACRCYGKVEDAGFYTMMKEGVFQILPSATVVNAAFSCEMFLKSLLKHNDISFEKTHSLYELYKLLPGDYKESIALYCGNTDVSGFEAVLRQHAKDFLNARYYVEHKEWYGMSPTFLFSLAYNLSTITNTYLEGRDIVEVLDKIKTCLQKPTNNSKD